MDTSLHFLSAFGFSERINFNIGGIMSELPLDKDEIATVIRSKKILNKIGMGGNLNIRKICGEIGISRKTAYVYDKKVNNEEHLIEEEVTREDLKEENRLLTVVSHLSKYKFTTTIHVRSYIHRKNILCTF